MKPWRLVLFAGMLLTGGCLWPVRESTDHNAQQYAGHPFDLTPEAELLPAPAKDGTADKSARSAQEGLNKKTALAPSSTDVQTTAYMQGDEQSIETGGGKRFDLHIPNEVPGSEAPLLKLPEDKNAKQEAIRKLFPPLPPMPEEIKPQPGPNGLPYTLADLQQIGAENSPALRQAAAAVEAARGNLIQAGAYPNPTISLQQQPNNDNATGAFVGGSIDQPIKTGGKLKLAVAAAQKDLDNAQLALKRSRTDLATQIRSAYFTLLVSKETLRVQRALARFTEEIYRLQTELASGGFGAAYEPAALRAQAFMIRLAYQQAIANYAYAWKQLVATVNLQQLPLSEVAGRIDRHIPAYEYDAFLTQVLNRHTDVLTARNGIDKAKYNLKLAQVTIIPDVDFQFGVFKELTLAPFGVVNTASVSFPIPLWDQNKGNIIAAQANLHQALEQPHRTEVTLTNGVATAFAAYKTNLDALEYYRRYILPDQVRAYRGVLIRRDVDPNAAFADLVTAQQTLATGVTTYLTTLGSLWSSVVSLADYLQTDDLFQTGKTFELPPLPELECVGHWPCPHPTASAVAGNYAVPAATFAATAPAKTPMPVPARTPVAAPLPVLTPMPTAPMFPGRQRLPMVPPADPETRQTLTPTVPIESTSFEMNPGSAKGLFSQPPEFLPDPATLGARPAESSPSFLGGLHTEAR